MIRLRSFEFLGFFLSEKPMELREPEPGVELGVAEALVDAGTAGPGQASIARAAGVRMPGMLGAGQQMG